MVTKEQAGTHSIFYHVTLKNADGTAVRCRANGMLKTWNTRPHDWRLPVKHGIRDYFYIYSNAEDSNAAEWTTVDPAVLAGLVRQAGLSPEAPWQMVHDRLEELHGPGKAAEYRALLLAR